MAAITTAIRGESARVEIDVATALAVSWKPLVKSKRSAIAIVTTSSVTGDSPVLHEDRLEHIRSVLAGVGRLLELLVDVLPANDRQRALARSEQVGDRLPGETVTFVLQLAQREQVLLGVAEPL